MNEYKNDDLNREAEYAAQGTETCEPCGQLSTPVENGIHLECAHREQFLSDREYRGGE